METASRLASIYKTNAHSAHYYYYYDLLDSKDLQIDFDYLTQIWDKCVTLTSYQCQFHSLGHLDCWTVSISQILTNTSSFFM